MTRRVDDAMAAERPEKRTMRALWVEEVERLADGDSEVPLYLTMPGARGGDIQALIDADIVNLTETSALADPEKTRLVAVENSPQAIVELQRHFPGLKILQEPIESLLHSDKLTAWPEGEHKKFFRARVVNFDLQCSLEASIKQGQLWFPTLALVRKLAILHAEPALDWTLCLTLHGQVNWDSTSAEKACQFLATNFEKDATFAAHAKTMLGKTAFDAICEDPSSVHLSEFAPIDQQRLLMVLVPKKIAFDAHTHGWCVDTVENVRYGGSEERAPMVSWILRFAWDDRATTQADVVYRESLSRVLARRGHINLAGQLHRD
jgi:hypothetical protein